MYDTDVVPFEQVASWGRGGTEPELQAKVGCSPGTGVVTEDSSKGIS